MTRRNSEHGGVPWYLMLTIVAAIGVGFVVYRVLHKRASAAAAERARAPKPAPKPIEVAAVPEAVPEAAEAPVPEEPVPAEPPPAAAGCDEVSCVLDNYEGACCARFKKPRAPRADGEVPENLDRAMITEGIAAVQERIAMCGDATGATGKVKVKVIVAADGSVTAATIQQTPDPALGVCVAATVKRARFTRTQTGGSFSYPFVF